MLEEYLKIKNPRQQRKYLDKKYLEFKNEEMTLENARDIIELNDYLNKNHFWQKYNSMFEQTVFHAKAIVLKEEIQVKEKELSSNNLMKYKEFVEHILNYEKDVVVDFYNAANEELGSILIYVLDNARREFSIVQAQIKLLEMFNKNGYLKIHYFNSRRILKKLKV